MDIVILLCLGVLCIFAWRSWRKQQKHGCCGSCTACQKPCEQHEANSDNDKDG